MYLSKSNCQSSVMRKMFIDSVTGDRRLGIRVLPIGVKPITFWLLVHIQLYH